MNATRLHHHHSTLLQKNIMEKEEIKKALSETIEQNQEQDGWTSLIKVGAGLKAKGIDYKSMGYEKLIQLIKEHVDTFNWKFDDDPNSKFPVGFVRHKTLEQKTKYTSLLRNKTNSLTSGGSVDPKNALTNWASLGDFRSSIEELKGLALNERWYYSRQNPRNPYPILVSYLKYTFYRLMKEGNKVMEKNDVAAFNTGLVDKRYEPIFALFSKTPNALRNWKLISFCIAGEDEGKDIPKKFNPLPQRAHYFDAVSDMLYDTRSPKPVLDWNHIIIENVDRLPKEFIEDNTPANFEIKGTDNMGFNEKEAYYDSLATAIRNDTKVYRNISYRFKDALELALKRIDWNFKTAIPTYFPTHNKMSLLLPLSLVDDEKVDIALVVEKTESGNYLGHTILTLEMAYNNSRLVCRPDSDWLIADDIQTEIDEDDLVEE